MVQYHIVVRVPRPVVLRGNNAGIRQESEIWLLTAGKSVSIREGARALDPVKQVPLIRIERIRGAQIFLRSRLPIAFAFFFTTLCEIPSNRYIRGHKPEQ